MHSCLFKVLNATSQFINSNDFCVHKPAPKIYLTEPSF